MSKLFRRDMFQNLLPSMAQFGRKTVVLQSDFPLTPRHLISLALCAQAVDILKHNLRNQHQY